MYIPRLNELGMEDRARTPNKGIRARLRTYLRKLGVVGKFRTDERRRLGGVNCYNLVVIGNIDSVITEFEGILVRFLKR